MFDLICAIVVVYLYAEIIYFSVQDVLVKYYQKIKRLSDNILSPIMVFVQQARPLYLYIFNFFSVNLLTMLKTFFVLLGNKYVSYLT